MSCCESISIGLWPSEFSEILSSRRLCFYALFRPEYVSGAEIVLEEFLPLKKKLSGRSINCRIDQVVRYDYDLFSEMYCTIYIHHLLTGSV